MARLDSLLAIRRIPEPKAFIPTLGVVESIVEFALAVALLAGIYQRVVAWATAALRAAFAVTMTIAHGVKVPLGYGVFTALGGALLLGAITDIRLSAEREPNMSNQPAQEAGR